MARRKQPGWLEDLGSLLPPPPQEAEHYFYVTQRPWPSLLFIMPGLLVFELFSYFRDPARPLASQLVATHLIDTMIASFGRSAFYLPALLAVAILLATHVAGRHPWKFDPFVLPGMLGESFIWTVPLLVFGRILLIGEAAGSARDAWIDQLLRSLGAGIYEELVFRLMCITFLAILLVNVFKLPRTPSLIFSILVSAGLFAAQHHPPFGIEPVQPQIFTFRTFAGLYLAGLCIFRGFGIACGCHALYNAILVTVPR